MSHLQKIILVTALTASFRRAGQDFTDKGTALLREQLTDEQFAQIIGEKRLSVREVTPDQIPEGAETKAIKFLLEGNGQAGKADGTQGPVTVRTFAEAFVQLDPASPDHFTQGGKPQLDPLSKLLGRTVSGAERDSEWDAYKAAGAAA
jgi:hypothetical protein